MAKKQPEISKSIQQDDTDTSTISSDIPADFLDSSNNENDLSSGCEKDNTFLIVNNGNNSKFTNGNSTMLAPAEIIHNKNIFFGQNTVVDLKVFKKILEETHSVYNESSLYTKVAVPMNSAVDFQQFVFNLASQPNYDYETSSNIVPPQSAEEEAFEQGMKPLKAKSNLNEYAELEEDENSNYFQAINGNEDEDSQFSGNTSRTSALFQVSSIDQMNLNCTDDNTDDDDGSLSYSQSKRYDSPCSEEDDEVSSIFTNRLELEDSSESLAIDGQLNILSTDAAAIAVAKLSLEEDNDLWDAEGSESMLGKNTASFSEYRSISSDIDDDDELNYRNNNSIKRRHRYDDEYTEEFVYQKLVKTSKWNDKETKPVGNAPVQNKLKHKIDGQELLVMPAKLKKFDSEDQNKNITVNEL